MRAFLRAGLVGLALLLAVPAAGQDYQKGVEAYERGDYATALREWRPLAAQGLAEAQYNLALMYDTGRGVPQADAEAVKWYRLAAAQGIAWAQNNLGLMYGNGEGVPLNNIKAYMWWALAKAQGDEKAAGNLDIVAERMTAADISEAQRLATEWWEEHME